MTRYLVAVLVVAFVAGFGRSCAHDAERRLSRLHLGMVRVPCEGLSMGEGESCWQSAEVAK